jgi:transposase
MFVRKKPNASGLVSVQVIDKSHGRYRVVKTIGASADPVEVDRMLREGKRFIQERTGVQEFDFTDHGSAYRLALGAIHSHRLVGISLVLGRIFEEIGFGQVPDPLFRDLVLYRLVYPRSKLKTTEYLFRYEQKTVSEDAIYRYMDKLHSSQKELVERISHQHTLRVLGGKVQAVFYDVTTLYFEVEREDELRKPGFSKDGKHQHPQIVLGLLVAENAYPLAYDIFEGDTFEGDTFLPVLDGFGRKYAIEDITVVADAGLLSARNIEQLVRRGYDFIIGARIKNEKQAVKDQVFALGLEDGQCAAIAKEGSTLIVSCSERRAKKDRYNREKGLRRLEKEIRSGKLAKSSINKKGYNKFLKMDGQVSLSIDHEKVRQDQRWDGLKGYLTNSKLSPKEVMAQYANLWEIEKAFRVAKNELRIRPIFHRKRARIEAHICLNFAAYKVYKELERQLIELKSEYSPARVIEVIQSIYEISLITPTQEVITKTIIITEEQLYVQKLFRF